MTDRETPRTHSILNDRAGNRGVAFSVRERVELGLTGRLPPAVLTLDEQADRAYRQLRVLPGSIARRLYLEHLRDRNETLYFAVLSGHPAELLPIVADPPAGPSWERPERPERPGRPDTMVPASRSGRRARSSSVRASASA